MEGGIPRYPNPDTPMLSDAKARSAKPGDRDYKLDTRKNHGFGGHDWPDCRDRRESYA